MHSNLLVLPYRGISPAIGEPGAFFDRGCAVLGRARIGRDAAMGPFAVVRADGHVVNAGDDFLLGAHATVHISHDLYGSTVGDRVTVGRNSVVHACTIGDDCVLDENVVVLDGAAVGSGSVLAAGSVVFPRTVLPAGQWCEGSPARAVRSLRPGERQAARERVRAAARECETDPTRDFSIDGAEGTFVAATAVGRARPVLGAASSIWFGCVVQAGGQRVHVGERSNVQDNSVMRATGRPIEIGDDTTVGHNVRLEDCTIGSRTLVGMGSRLAPGTVVHDDVFVAAGTLTTEGQVLGSGSLWGGRPARPIAPLGDAHRKVIAQAAAMYCEYAAQFARVQAALEPKTLTQARENGAKTAAQRASIG